VPLDTIDPAVIGRCQDGDQAAFDELYSLLKDDLYRWIYSMMRDYDDTEEVFQDCTIRLFRHIKSLKDPKRFKYWLYRLVVNQCNTHRSKKGRHSYTPLEESIEVKPEDCVFRSSMPENPRSALMRKELMENINHHISALPAKQRIAVTLFDVQGLSIKEVANHLDCSEGAVKFNIHEARKKLRITLGPLVKRPHKKGDD
jgi:RNA polymerase sigma-70 factor, ECF subfamily